MKIMLRLSMIDYCTPLAPMVEYLSTQVDDSARPEIPENLFGLKEHFYGSDMTAYVLPSPEFLRWMADMVELARAVHKP